MRWILIALLLVPGAAVAQGIKVTPPSAEQTIVTRFADLQNAIVLLFAENGTLRDQVAWWGNCIKEPGCVEWSKQGEQKKPDQ